MKQHVHACMLTNPKELVADGDYLAFKEWWDQNADNILKEGKQE